MKRINYFAVITMMLFLGGLAFSQSRYTEFGNINHGPVTVTSTWTKLNTTAGTHSFTKTDKNTTIEVYVNSRFMVGAFSGANGVVFQARVDKITPNFENWGSILVSDTQEFLSIFAVFQKLSPGQHTVSLWARAAGGSASKVVVDPGGWGGKIIVKETL